MNIKNKIKKLKEFSINSLIYNTYYHRKIDERLVYVESRDGKDFTGNIFRIVEELSTGKYGDFKIYVYAKKDVHSKIQELQKNYPLKINKIISSEAIATTVMERAKYLITDSGMRHKYVKREGQIVLNTWHGTPLKTMGKYNEPEQHRCGNIQQVFFACDYLLYPNDYMKEKMLTSYMMEKIYPGTILLEGYPRNSIFLDKEEGLKLKEKLGFKNKELFAYMPTFKGKLLNRKDNKQKDEIENYLKELDDGLNDNQILLVKLHVYNQEKINFKEFKHIKAFPSGYEIYDILNMTDALITDYSSVFFDYANTKRKIIIFNYDESEYMKDRGTYFPISDLPFPKVQNIKDLLIELNSPKNYDDNEFLEKYCTYDRLNAVEYLCRHVFNNEEICTEETIKNDKKNVLIFAGGLLYNGITSSLISILSNVDRSENNYFISYRTWDNNIKKNHSFLFSVMPENVEFAPFRTNIIPTLFEKIKFNRYLKSSRDAKYPKMLESLFKREYKRSFNNFTFDSILQFSGYGVDQTLILNNPKSNKSIWVHNDMMEEIKNKNKKAQVLKKIYNEFENVCVVSPDLIEPASKISGKKDNIHVIHNINNYKQIIDNSKKDLKFDDNTVMITSHVGGIEEVLNSDGKKFITIGRFAPEKSHERLIRSFNKFCQDYPDSQLIIIGGYGTSYNATRKLIEKLEYGHNITIIKWVSNPMPILKKCDLFILSSLYEGWPMVIMEADTLNIPVIATSIVGTQWMKNYNSYLVENSEDGLLQGMYDFMEGKVDNNLGINYEEYNKKAIDEFLEIL